MRHRRIKRDGEGIYHCMSRTVNGEKLLNEREKEVLRRMIRQMSEFSGVEVLTYCVLGNHFHVLLREKTVEGITDVELMRRYRLLYPKPTKYQVWSAGVLESKLKKGGPEAEEIRRKLKSRMGDVSEYMKGLKQRFSIWYNRTHNRYGTLWSERFKSVLVEGGGRALRMVCAYIDLNPVRAGLVKDPKDYRYSGYGEAVGGGGKSLSGLMEVWQEGKRESLESHRMLLYGVGGDESSGKAGVMSRREVLRVLEEEKGKLPVSSVLRCRVRYFSDGAVLGSGEFVRGYVQEWQKQRERKKPPKVTPLRGADWGDLAVIRGLRRRVFS